MDGKQTKNVIKLGRSQKKKIYFYLSKIKSWKSVFWSKRGWRGHISPQGVPSTLAKRQNECQGSIFRRAKYWKRWSTTRILPNNSGERVITRWNMRYNRLVLFLSVFRTQFHRRAVKRKICCLVTRNTTRQPFFNYFSHKTHLRLIKSSKSASLCAFEIRRLVDLKN